MRNDLWPIISDNQSAIFIDGIKTTLFENGGYQTNKKGDRELIIYWSGDRIRKNLLWGVTVNLSLVKFIKK